MVKIILLFKYHCLLTLWVFVRVLVSRTHSFGLLSPKEVKKKKKILL